MIEVNKTTFERKEIKVKVNDGLYFFKVMEGGIESLIKIDIYGEDFKFTRLVNGSEKFAIIYKEGSKTLPWVVECHFNSINNKPVNNITEEEFEKLKETLIKLI